MASESERQEAAAAAAALKNELASALAHEGRLALPAPDGWDWYRYINEVGWREADRSSVVNRAQEMLIEHPEGGASTRLAQLIVGAAASTTCAPSGEAWDRRIALGHPAGAWSLATGETVPGIPFADAVVQVKDDGELIITDADSSVFDRRGSIPFRWGEGVPDDTPRAREWLTRFLPEGVDWRWPLRWVGAAMDGWPRHQTMLLLIGEPDAGKSAFAEFAGGLAGAVHSVRGNLSALTATHGLAGLPAARVLSIPEFTANARNDRPALHVLKQLTGCDPVDIEPKGRDAYSIVWGGLVIACTNTMPSFTRRAGGLWRVREADGYHPDSQGIRGQPERYLHRRLAGGRG